MNAPTVLSTKPAAGIVSVPRAAFSARLPSGTSAAASNRGLTLIEVMCVLAISTMLLGTLLGTLTLTARAMTAAQESARRNRILAGMERVLRADIQAAFIAGDQQLFAFCAVPSPGHNEPCIEFFTTNAISEGQSANDSARTGGIGVNRVSYRLSPVADKEEVFEIHRREVAWTPGKVLPDAASERLVGGVTLWRLAFHDGLEWRDRWKRNALPLAVRLEVSFEDDPAGSVHAMQFTPLATPGADPMPKSGRL